MHPRILPSLENVRTGVFPGTNGPFGDMKFRRGILTAGFLSSRFLGIGPIRVDFGVFGSQKLVFGIAIRRFFRLL